MNYSPIDPVRLLQIWIVPNEAGVEPAYAERSFAGDRSKGLTLVASPDGRSNSVSIHQDADVWLARLDPRAGAHLHLGPERHAWVQVAEGELVVNGQTLQAGDGAALSDVREIRLDANTPAQALLFDLN